MTNDENIKDTGGRLLIDKKKCQGCMTCMLACSLVHEGKENLSLSRIQVLQSYFEKYPNDIQARSGESCDLCLDTPYWKEKGGVDGKQACVEACPVGAVRLSTEMPATSEDGEGEADQGIEGDGKAHQHHNGNQPVELSLGPQPLQG